MSYGHRCEHAGATLWGTGHPRSLSRRCCAGGLENRATEKPPWQPQWLALLKQVRDLIPCGWTGIVRADRGLDAKGLFHAIVALGGPPLRRLHQRGKFRPQGGYHWVPVTTLVPAVGQRWAGQGTAFTGKDTPWDCTLVGCWGAGHHEAWLVLTDLPPHAAQACWYGLRAGNRARV